MGQEFLKIMEPINAALTRAGGAGLTSIAPQAEGVHYHAHTAMLGRQAILMRVAKTTPTKTGQFVTLWKRNASGLTVPISGSDEYQWFLVIVKDTGKAGFFLFSKEILLKQKILSGTGSTGKRGFRIYPIWAITHSQQAAHTKTWQVNFFFELPCITDSNLQRLRKLLQFK